MTDSETFDVVVSEVLLDAEFDELFDERFVFGFHKGYAFVRWQR